MRISRESDTILLSVFVKATLHIDLILLERYFMVSIHISSLKYFSYLTLASYIIPCIRFTVAAKYIINKILKS